MFDERTSIVRRKMLRRALAVLVVAVVCGLAAGEALADIIIVGEVGFGSNYRDGCWVPIVLEVSNDSGVSFPGSFVFTGGDTEGNVIRFVSPVDITARMRKRIFLYGHLGYSSSENLKIELYDHKGKRRVECLLPLSHKAPYAYEDNIVGVLGRDTLGVFAAFLDVDKDKQTDEPRLHVLPLQAARFPDRRIGLEMLDVLFWPNADASQLTPAQQKALVEWVFSGGRLVVCLSGQWRTLWESSLRAMLPAEVIGPVTLKRATALSHFARASLSESVEFEACRVAATRGEVIVGTPEFPFIVDGPYGSGRVSLVTFDPGKAPFKGWSGTETIWKKLASETLGLDAKRDETTAQAAKSFVETRDDVRPFSFHWAGLFLLVYVLAVGPIDYLVLKRKKKLRWTWITFPATALVFSAVALAGVNAVKQVELLVKTYNVIEFPHEGDWVRKLSYVGIHSPIHSRYDVHPSNPGASLEEAGLYDRWLDEPGYYRRRSRPALPGGKRFTSIQTDRMDIKGYPINIWSVRNFKCERAEWGGPKPLDCRFSIEGGRLVGSIRNNTSLEFNSLYVCTSEGAFTGGRLAPHSTRRFSTSGSGGLVKYSRGFRSRHPFGLSYDWIGRHIDAGNAVVICKSNDGIDEVDIGVAGPESASTTILHTVAPIGR